MINRLFYHTDTKIEQSVLICKPGVEPSGGSLALAPAEAYCCYDFAGAAL
jgi:hypothetical protein